MQALLGRTETRIIGTRHGEKRYETLMTREEAARCEDMGRYFRVAADDRDLNYDKYVVQGTEREPLAAYTSDNTQRLDVQGVQEKLLTTDYIRRILGIPLEAAIGGRYHGAYPETNAVPAGTGACTAAGFY